VRKRYCSLILLIALFICNLHTTFAGTYSGGAGTEANPYQISKAEDLIELTTTFADCNKHFIQTANISFNSDPSQQDWNGNGNAGPVTGFIPIGNNTIRFTGVYNGDGHTISNLFINCSNQDILGLFGRVDGSAEIKNLGLLNVNITGKNNVGGLVGYNSGGNISHSYTVGSVIGNNNVGGFVGYNSNGSIITCYTTTNIEGDNNVGGFVGYNTGTITSSYSAGSVIGNEEFGGFVGYNSSGSYSNCFWDTETSGQETSAGGTGKTTAEMKTESTFTNWDFDNVWNIKSVSAGATSYPYLQAIEYDEPGAEPEVNPIPGLEMLYAGGEGTEVTPFLIANTTHLNNVRLNLDKHFKQIANIAFNQADFGEDGAFYNGGAGWEPIGNSITSFIGVYDGDGHTITNLLIDLSITDNVGLFGFILSSAHISNLGLIDVDINGQNDVGGLVGYCSNSTIERCYSTGSVSGTNRVGGLVGSNVFSATISNSYSTGSVSGTDRVGGLVGSNSNSSISNSYSTGSVSSNGSVGGLVGLNFIGNYTNCFWDTETSGRETSAGGTGKTTAEMKTQNTFTGWDFQDVWNIKVVSDGATSYPYLRAIEYDTPGAEPEVNPIPGLEMLYAGGEGTEETPFLIANTTHLNNVRLNLDKHFKQIANIAFNQADFEEGGDFYNEGEGWVPIGTNYELSFRGVYNGYGHTISNLYINRPNTDNIGLFGFVGHAHISNLGLIDVDITGHNVVGGFVGYCVFSSIERCYSAGNVIGSYTVGGFVGYVVGNMSNNYSTGSVSGVGYVGGFAGSVDEGTISYSYSTSSVSGNWIVGGFVGDGQAPNCFWDKETSGRETSAGGTGKTTAEMKTQSTFTDWDFQDVWSIKSVSAGATSYPYLRAIEYDTPGAEPEVNPIPGLEMLYAGGTGETFTRFLIATKAHLNNVRLNLDKNFRQIADIEFTEADFEEGGDFYNGGAGWEPIGNSTTDFTGRYDGNKFKISNLYINRPTADTIGLFGRVSGNLIEDIGLINVEIKGKNNVGSLVGWKGGTNSSIRRCYSTGVVEGSDDVGGLIGYNTGATNNSVIRDSYSTCNVTGTTNVGGFIGRNDFTPTESGTGTIRGCYSTGIVTGTTNVGGFNGFTDKATVTQCYSVGSVTGTTNVGGFIGNSAGGTITVCYWDTETSDQISSAGGNGVIGRTTAEMKNRCTYSALWDFKFDRWTIWSGLYISYPILRLLQYSYDAVDSDAPVNPIPGLGDAAVFNPSDFTATATSSSTINLSWALNENDDEVLLTFDTSEDICGLPDGIYNVGDEVPLNGGTVLYVGADVDFEHTGLDANTQYYYKIWSKDTDGKYSTGTVRSPYTLVEIPGQPTISDVGFSSFNVSFEANNNPTSVNYAIRVNGDKYVNNSGNLVNNPVWRSHSLWHPVGNNNKMEIKGLNANSNYVVDVVARNSNSKLTEFSPNAETTTSIAIPGKPTLFAPTQTTLNILVDANTNSHTTLFAIYAGNHQYVQADGTLDWTQVWQTLAAWHTDAENTAKTITGLSPNTEYTFSVYAKIAMNDAPTVEGDDASLYTLPIDPLTPTVSHPSPYSLDVTINETNDVNLDLIEYAIRVNGNKYVQENGSLGNSPFWQTFDNWHTDVDNSAKTITGLSPNTEYSIDLKARNADNLETDFSDAAELFTSVAVPGKTSLFGPTLSSFGLTIDANDNPANTQFAIQVNETYYVQLDGTLSSEAVWQTIADWHNEACSTLKIITDLDVNTEYIVAVKARKNNDPMSETDFSDEASIFTLANTPSKPTLSGAQRSSVRVVIEPNGNPDNTEYALFVESEDYVQSDGSIGPNLAWKTKTNWESTIIDDLNYLVITGFDSPATVYAVKVKARNGDDVETDFSELSEFETLPNLPIIESLTGPTQTTIDFAIDANENPNTVEYAIFLEVLGYLQENGTYSSNEYWATIEYWSDVKLTGLTPNTQYIVAAKARNTAEAETEFGEYSTLYTLPTVPVAPTLSNPSPYSLDVTINETEDANLELIEYAIAFRQKVDGESCPSCSTYYVFSGEGESICPSCTTAVYFTKSDWYNFAVEGVVRVYGLTPATEYEVRLIARNADDNVTDFGPFSEGMFTLETEPNHAIHFDADSELTTPFDITLIWDNPSQGPYPDGYVIKGSLVSYEDIVDPIDGIDEDDDDLLVIIVEGDILSVTFSGLEGDTEYFFKIYPYRGQGVTTNYNTTDVPETSETTLVAYPTVQASGIRFYDVTRTGMRVVWTNGDGEKRILLAKTTRFGSSPLNDNEVYTANLQFGSGDKVDRTAYVLYNGMGSEAVVTGMRRNTSYHFRVIEYNEPKEDNTWYLQEVNRSNPLSRHTLRKETDTENMAVISDFVYPNPAKDVINLELELGAEGIFSAALYDETGRLVKNLGEDYRTASVHSFTWQVGDLSNGFYILMLSHNNEAMTLPVHIAR